MTVIRCTSPVTKGKRMGQPCGMPIAGNLPDGVPACAGHLARSGDPVAAAKLAANLSSSGARGKRSRARKPSADPLAEQLAELRRLKDGAERRRDHAQVVRYSEQISELIQPSARAAADAGAGPAAVVVPERVHVRAVLAHLSDAELETLKALAVVFDRAVGLARAGAPPPAVVPVADERPVIVTVEEEKKE